MRTYPYGYKFAKDDTITVNKDKAKVVKMIYMYLIEGKNRSEIQNILISKI